MDNDVVIIDRWLFTITMYRSNKKLIIIITITVLCYEVMIKKIYPNFLALVFYLGGSA